MARGYRLLLSIAGAIALLAGTTGVGVKGTRPAPTGDILSFPSFGVTIKLPKDWARIAESGSEMIFQAAKIVNGQETRNGVIRMAISHANVREHLPTLESFAKDIANRQNLVVETSEVKVGGEKAIELTGGPAVRRGIARIALARAVEHSGHYYLISQIAAEADTLRGGFDEIAASLKWTDFKPPLEAIASRNAEFALGTSGVVCDMPDPFRLDHRTETQILCSAFNFGTETLDAEMAISIDGAAMTDFKPFKELFSSKMQKRFTGKPTWTDREDGSVTYTDLVTLTDEPVGKPARRMQLICAASSEGSAVIELDLPADSGTEYSKAVVPNLVKSIRSTNTDRGVISKPPTTAPAKP